MGTEVWFRRTVGRRSRARAGALVLVLATVVAGCGNDSADPSDRPGAGTERTAPDGAVFNDADVAFVAALIAHHQQTVEIADLASVPGNEASPWLLPLAERIGAARRADIERLEALRDSWGGVPATTDTTSGQRPDGHVSDPTDVPGTEGMMTADEMIELTTTTGGDFDRLWLAMMVRHHDGAIAMAQRLLADGRNGELQSFAASSSAAHQAEVTEMENALTAVSPTTR